MKIAVLFDNLGPYHVARLTELGRRCDLLAVEIKAVSNEYAWTPTAEVGFPRVTLAMGGRGRERSPGLEQVLAGFAPDVVFVPGWSAPEALRAHLWAARGGTPVVVMSDTQAIDFRRHRAKEWVKRTLVHHAAAAFVGGSRHVEYASSLLARGTPILPAYDVVDNAHFEAGARAARSDGAALRRQRSLPDRYLLAAARFVEKKNLLLLLDAYARSRHLLERRRPEARPWDLTILGDGPLRPAIESRIAALGLGDAVHLPGFRQHSELPAFYGLAEAFVIPSTTDQWGLVVNEAMASGLPVLVSEGCGCAPDLVEPGVNGFLFDPSDAEGLAGLLTEMGLASPDRRKAMGEASLARIRAWSPETFAGNAVVLARAAVERPARRMRLPARMLALAVAEWHRRKPRAA